MGQYLRFDSWTQFDSSWPLSAAAAAANLFLLQLRKLWKELFVM
jgi:hypothetical protein